ncbi:hypothetical protein DID88_006716 [Monilinia fructigena]|uniref:Uncharacterized protein n=1 Tax=Monilinia fructigena TaxID=38457 RepID=A0A395IG09_9HELO|nr:hypothetical protein DID88_006716 [Monilinia fructigena]
MADITDQHDQNSPSALMITCCRKWKSIAGTILVELNVKDLPPADDDDDDDDKPGRERRKSRSSLLLINRVATLHFQKRRPALKSSSWSCPRLVLVYTFTTPKLQPLVTKAEGKNLIQACLNAPEPTGNGENGVDDGNTVESPEEPTPQHLPPQQQGRPGMPQQVPQMHPGYGNVQGLSAEQQQALAYQNYMAHQQRGGYMPPQAGIPQQQAHQS